jgi:hypothetical protein
LWEFFSHRRSICDERLDGRYGRAVGAAENAFGCLSVTDAVVFILFVRRGSKQFDAPGPLL